MLTLGGPEILVIIVLALVLFGPKKLPELARTLGKAMTEFNRARNDLKATFEREMKSLDQETLSIQKIAQDTVRELADHSSYDYGLPKAEEIWNPLDHEEHETEQAVIAPPAETSPEYAEVSETPATQEALATETVAASETVLDAVPTIVPATEGTVARTNIVGNGSHSIAQTTEELTASIQADVPEAELTPADAKHG
jgi:TatA/E family protein of Tat protein translocase